MIEGESAFEKIFERFGVIVVRPTDQVGDLYIIGMWGLFAIALFPRLRRFEIELTESARAFWQRLWGVR
jgi:hypothetical protein